MVINENNNELLNYNLFKFKILEGLINKYFLLFFIKLFT